MGARRVLRPGGRLVFGDMMFSLGLRSVRDRRAMADNVRAMVRNGPAGGAQLAKNGARLATGRWEQPADAEWWRSTLRTTGFGEVAIQVRPHQGGIAKGLRT